MLIEFPDISKLGDVDDLVAIGGTLSSQNLIEAYKNGYFPMPIEDQIGWFSPQERAVLNPNKFTPSKSLKKSIKKFTTTINQDFAGVMDACGDPKRPHGWINSEIKNAYGKLHSEGYAHSFEVWNNQNTLVGGLYGVKVGRLFAGESMFHLQTDASKVALAATVSWLNETTPGAMFDAQWQTPHLESLGFDVVSRNDYKTLLDSVLC